MRKHDVRLTLYFPQSKNLNWSVIVSGWYSKLHLPFITCDKGAELIFSSKLGKKCQQQVFLLLTIKIFPLIHWHPLAYCCASHLADIFHSEQNLKHFYCLVGSSTMNHLFLTHWEVSVISIALFLSISIRIFKNKHKKCKEQKENAIS